MPIYRKGDDLGPLAARAKEDRAAMYKAVGTQEAEDSGIHGGILAATGEGPFSTGRAMPVSGDALATHKTSQAAKSRAQKRAGKISGKFTGEQIRSGALRKIAEGN